MIPLFWILSTRSRKFKLHLCLLRYHIYWESEVESFVKVFFKAGKKQSNLDFASLNSYLNPAVDRYNAKAEEDQENFKSTLTEFVRSYAFVSNIVRLEDAQMHKFHAYAKLLLRKLPKETSGTVHLKDEVSLQYYRVQKMFEGSIALSKGDVLSNDKHAGKGKKADEESTLSELVEWTRY